MIIILGISKLKAREFELISDMDSISQLPEALLLKILSFLPTTKDVVATMVLSKRWQFLWMLVPRLVYDDGNRNFTNDSFSKFVDRSLLLHEAPVLEYLRFKLNDVDNIGVWARTVSRRHVRELVIEIDRSSCTTPTILPKRFYAVSGMLVTLKLNNVVLVDDVSSPVSFPSLKKLSLDNIIYPGGDGYVNRLLSNCPVLEDLFVNRWSDDNVTVFTVRVPSLKILYTRDIKDSYGGEMLVIDAPSLETLTIDDSSGVCVVKNEMPNIVTADLNFYDSRSWKILSSITPVKDLCLCLSFSKKQGYQADQPNPIWSKLSLVPECLLTSLETLEWKSYEGTKEEKEMVEFILRNGRCLQKVTISSKPTDSDKKLEMIKELELSFRRSPICQLVFD